MARKKKTITVKGSTKKKQAQKKKGVSQQQSLTVNVITGRRKASGKISVRPAKPPIVFSPVINLGKAENTPAPPAPPVPPPAAANRVSFQIPQPVAAPNMVNSNISFETEEPEFFNLNLSRQSSTEPKSIMIQRPENISQPMRYEDEMINLTKTRDMLEIPKARESGIEPPYTKLILPPPIGNEKVVIPPSSRTSIIPIEKIPTEEISWRTIPSLPVSIPLPIKEMMDELPPLSSLDDEELPELPQSKREKGRPIITIKNPTPKDIKKMEKNQKARERYRKNKAKKRNATANEFNNQPFEDEEFREEEV